MKKEENSTVVSAEVETTFPFQSGQVVLAHVQSFDDVGRPNVVFFVAGDRHCYPALTTSPLTKDDLNKQVAISFLNSSLDQPLILGTIYSPLYEYLENIEISKEQGSEVADERVSQPVLVDGKKVIIEGSDSIELRCGEASISLSKDGKILIKGKYLLNRSSGVNRIVGGSVQVN